MVRGSTAISVWCFLFLWLSPVVSCYGQPQNQQAEKENSAQGAATSAEESGLTQDVSTTSEREPGEFDASLGRHVFKDFVQDQKAIWASPFHVRLVDAEWLVPLGGAAAVMFATDTDVSKHLNSSPSRISNSNSLANYGIASLAAAGGGMYLWGHLTHNDHMRETGFLAGEAALDSLAATYALKYTLRRERPLQDNFQGQFWHGGDSFPSEHSSAAWSIASVIAHEYPGPLTSVVAYGLAAGISASRITAQQHFPSDVLVGSALGWFIGKQIYSHHHDPTLGGGDWETYSEAHDQSSAQSSGASLGSPYVELDSWVYPAIDKLAALGYIHSQYFGMRPWTRIECASLVEEASDEIRSADSIPSGIGELYDELQKEFMPDLDAVDGGKERSIRLDSLYTTVTGISGRPLSDSAHFGETIINNYGRPYEEGVSTYDGFSGYATAGRFALYIRGEYQLAPSGPAYPLATRQAIAAADQNPVLPPTPVASVSQFTLLDTYVAANAGGWDLAFGKQSLWWGPEEGGPLIFSDNAAPIYMFRGSRITPFEVPLLSRILGPMKLDFFVGKLSGNEFPPRPVLHGEKISFKMTRDIEIGFSRLVEFGGEGRPLTAGAIWNSYVSTKSSGNYRASANPGKRTPGFDFIYAPHYIHNGLQLYADFIAGDDIVALEAPARDAIISGVYFPRLPRLSKLDLRLEAGYTDPVTPRSNNGDFIYWDFFYHDLSVNKNNLVGSWIGREGKGIQAWTTYSFSARNNIQFGFRQSRVSKDFIPGGETIDDASVKVNWLLRDSLSVSAYVQYENWLIPILASGRQTNLTSSVQVTFTPRSWTK